MDLITSNSFFIYLIVLSTIILAFLLYHRLCPEKINRLRIKRTIKNQLNSDLYTFLENVDVRGKDGHRLQIKQMLISRYGIFILETCHHRSIIHGSHHQVKWLSKGAMHSIPFTNPHMELQPTIQKLTRYLHLPEDCFKSVIIFTGNSRFPNAFPENTCKLNTLMTTIVKNRTVLINPGLLTDIATVLKLSPKVESITNSDKVNTEI